MAHIPTLISSAWLFLAVFLILIAVVSAKNKGRIALLATGISGLVTSVPAVYALTGTPFSMMLAGINSLGTVEIAIDGLSAWFVIIINLIAVVGALYGMGYLKPYSSQHQNLSLHWGAFVVFHLSMLWVVMLRHTLAFLVMWEIMSVSSMLLVMFNYSQRDTFKAALSYLIQMHVGVAILTAAFLWAYFTTGSWQMSSVAKAFEAHQSVGLFLLFFAGFGLKAGFIPFHTWLPKAHPAAPSHVSGVMSGVIVKMGIYGILRVAGFLPQSLLMTAGEILMLISTATALYGILLSAIQKDLKRLLAFCTVENIGIIGMAIGLGMVGKSLSNHGMMMAGYGAALLHTLNHALFKPLLFFVAGNVYTATHSRNIESLGGLLKKMPVTAILFLVGAMAIGGLPPFNGFISEFVLYSGLVAGFRVDSAEISTLMAVSLTALVMVGGLSVFAFTRAFGVTFLGSPRTTLKHEPKEVSKLMLFSPVLLAGLMVMIGVFPGLLLIPLNGALMQLTGISLVTPPAITVLNLLTRIGTTSGILIAVAGALWLVRGVATRNLVVERSDTWGCGYNAGTPRIQYTGMSFTRSLTKLSGFILNEKKHFQEIENHHISPEARSFFTHYPELFETRIIRPLLWPFLMVFNLFVFIHNGRVQSYVLYGIAFILLILIGTMLNLI